MLSDFKARPHSEAIALIKGKPVVTRAVFDQMLPELRGRAFTVSGIEGANVLQRVRDTLATLPQGGREGTWDNVKKDLVAELDPYLGDNADQRAELLLRTHGFQAFQASNWRVAQEDADTTHLQYLTMEDDRVRPSHAALDGLVLPKDDPFWDTHTPPWDWGCRCRIRPMNPDLVDIARAQDEKQNNPENRNVIEGAALDQLRNGTLMRDGQRIDVTPPSDRASGGYSWHPDDLRLSLPELQSRYDADVFAAFAAMAHNTKLGGQSLWDWLKQYGV